jgi:hypothetical protein
MLLQFGALIPLGGFFRDRAWFAAAVGVPSDKLLRIQNLESTRPQFLLWQNKTQRFSISFDVAVRLAPGLAFGAGMQITQQQSGYYRFGLDVPNRIVTARETHVDVVFQPAPVMGLMWEPSSSVRVGFVWRGEQVQRTDVPTDFDLGSLGSLSIQTGASGFYWPHVFALGASYRPASRHGELLITAQLELQLWSHAPSDEVQFAMVPQGDVLNNLGLAGLLTFNGPAKPAGLSSILVPRLGAELQLAPVLAMRAGVTIKPPITPEQTGSTSYLDGLTTTVGLGFGFKLPGIGEVFPEPILLDIAATASILTQREMHKSSVSDPTGDANFGGAIWGLSAMLRYAY